MIVKSINLNSVNQNNNIKRQSNINMYTQSSDCVSFSGAKKADKAPIPYRLQSKLQDDFHITGRQVRIRDFLEKQSQGLSNEEIAKATFSTTFESGSEEEKAEVLAYTQNMQKKIDELDASFKKVIPSLFPKTYYRGIVDSSSNRALEVIKEAKVGDVIKPDLGYPFMASKLEYAEGFSQYTDGSSDPETCAVMIIKTPAGTPISRDISFNLFSGDSNAVLARGANFEVLDKKIENNKTYITLQYLNCALDE